jgi:hypothetical protein
MTRKSKSLTKFSTALASFMTLAAVMVSTATAASATPLDGDTNLAAQDQRQAQVRGELVRIVAADSAACVRKSAPVAEVAAIQSAAIANKVRLARLEAELQGRDEIVLPPEAQAASIAEAVADALHAEQSIMASDQEAMSTKFATLNEEKVLRQREIELTVAKKEAFERQEALMRQELDNINGLTAKGLAIVGQNLTIQQNLLQLQAARLDIELTILKARGDAGQIDRNIAELRSLRRNEILAETNKTRSDLAKLTQQARSASSETAARSAQGECANGSKGALYVILREPDGSLRAIAVGSSNGSSPTAGEELVSAR